MRDLDTDLILAQEASAAAIPGWVADEWTLLTGERGKHRKNWNWGSVIAARPGLHLRHHVESLEDPWFQHLYDLVLVARMDLPESASAIVASVHTAEMAAGDWIDQYGLREYPGIPLPITDDEVVALKRPGCKEVPYINDFAFTALDRIVKDERFIVSGAGRSSWITPSATS
jgi:hypothetical protein